MTSKEFIMWLKGFMTAASQSEPIQSNWILIKEELSKVQDHSECQCGKKTYTYPYQGYAGDITITNTGETVTYTDPFADLMVAQTTKERKSDTINKTDKKEQLND